LRELDPLLSRNKREERRASPRVYRLLLTTHVLVSGVWLGVAVAKLTLAVVALTTGAPAVSDALYSSMRVVYLAFPSASVATLVTGVLLSLGTKWGLLRHYWVATKLALSIGVIVTGVALADRLVQESIAASGGGVVGAAAITEVVSAPATLLISLSVAHALMLGFATVLSVYKPWGRTGFGQHKAIRASYEEN
jgi:hypothetical protein